MKGIVKWYDVRKGYGFIQGEGGKHVFVHKSTLPFWTIYLNVGDRVEFELEPTPRGEKATDIKII